MKTSILRVAILALSLTAAAQPAAKAPDQPQQRIDETTAQLRETISQLDARLGDLRALDKSDAELKKSDQAQIDTSHMIDRGLHKIEFEDAPRVIERARQFDIKRQQYIDSGCPPEGGTVSKEVADRCNPVKDRLNAEGEQILAEGKAVAKSKADYERLRADVTAKTLANAAQEKANIARREDLMSQEAQLEATRKRLEARLLDLKTGVDSCAKLLQQQGVICEKIKAKCGLIFDGGDPNLPPSIYDSPCGKPPAAQPR